MSSSSRPDRPARTLTRGERSFLLVGNRRPTKSKRPPGQRRAFARSNRALPARDLAQTVWTWTPPRVAALALTATGICLALVAALWVAGPIGGAFLASGGGGAQIAAGAALGLVTPAVSQWLYGRRWWTQPAALCLATDRRFTALPGDSTLRVAIHREDAERALAAFEAAGFWYVRVFEAEHPRGFDAQIEGVIRTEAADNELQYAYDVLNKADVRFWPLEPTLMPLGPTVNERW